jgi:hypothetical protein
LYETLTESAATKQQADLIQHNLDTSAAAEATAVLGCRGQPLNNTTCSSTLLLLSAAVQVPGLVNVDFADVRAVMTNAGSSLMGQGRASGQDR